MHYTVFAEYVGSRFYFNIYIITERVIKICILMLDKARSHIPRIVQHYLQEVAVNS